MNSTLLLAIGWIVALSLTPALHAGDRGGRGAHAKKAHGNHAHPANPKPDTPGTRDPGVNARQHRQRDRTAQGVRSGQLTKDEAQEIIAQQKTIRAEEKAYKSDGTLTKEERKDLHQDLNAASKNIFEEKHDAETRPDVTPAEPGAPGARDPGVNAHQAAQKKRIVDGVQDGTLTKKETATLAHKEQQIARLEKRLKEDGTLSLEERARLKDQLRSLSAEIYRQKHDAQTAATPH